MGLFDILNTPEIRSVLTTLASEAQAGARQIGQKAEEGFRQMGSSAPGGMGGLFGAGALGALLGGMMPKAGSRAVGMVGLGMLAWNFYKKWSSSNGQSPQAFLSSQEGASANGLGAAFGPASAEAAAEDPTALLLLRAMIFAARADGHIDAVEEERIAKLLPQLFAGVDMRPLMTRLMEEPIDTEVFAKDIRSVEEAEDLYRLSCVIVDIDHFMERGYFAQLAASLHIAPERAKALEAEAAQARAQLEAM